MAGALLSGSGLIGSDNDLYQGGASVMHTPSGLGVYGLYQWESGVLGSKDTNVWYVKPFWKNSWSPLGSTVLYGEYGQYNDQFASLTGVSTCSAFVGLGGTSAGKFCGAAVGNSLIVTGSEVQRWGLGVVQEIDSAAMHLFARWQHQDIDVDFVGTSLIGSSKTVNQGFDDWDLFQVGGVIFF